MARLTRVAGLALAAALLAAFAGVATAHCPNFCSGHGTCSFDRTMQCTCFEGWTAADCSERLCATGKAWVGYSESTDGLHTQEVECSNMGECNRQTGLCSCMSGFGGLACEKLMCPNDCNGHGKCMSLERAATTVDDRALTVDTTYTTPWDHDMIFGCVCDLGFYGYDCSLRTCPSGDDPETRGQADEVQFLNCLCDTCSGYFFLTFRGETTGRISHNAVATIAEEDPDVLTPGLAVGESVEAKLEALRTITGVTVSFDSGTSVCSAGGVATNITFDQTAGNVPELRVSSSLTAGSGTVTLSIDHGGAGSSSDGTTEDAVCNNRGICDPSTGVCSCFEGYGSSDGAGSPGNIPDCGARDGTYSITTCPSDCSGHGTCDLADYTCTCYRGFTGGDCSLRECPTYKAWWDEPYDTDVAHRPAECANMGICDVSTGVCTCRDGWTGAACQRTECPGRESLRPCSQRGRCLSNRELTRLGTSNGEFRGELDIQTVTCTATSGTFALVFRYSTTPDIAWNADANTVRQALEDLPTVGLVTVNFASGVTEACSGSGNEIQITFDYDWGPLDDLSGSASTGSLSFSHTITGSRVTYGETEGNSDTWDFDMLHGCHCDGTPHYKRITESLDTGYFVDYACTLRSCPHGHDVLLLETNAVATEQTIDCSLSSGSFVLEFRNQFTPSLSFSASEVEVEAALEALDSIGDVTVTFDTTATACDAGGNGIVVTFNTNVGSLPLIRVYPSTNVAADMSVSETVVGNSTMLECAGRGTCDRTLGLCKCFEGFVSGDGFGNKGTRGDCGAQDPLFRG